MNAQAGEGILRKQTKSLADSAKILRKQTKSKPKFLRKRTKSKS